MNRPILEFVDKVKLCPWLLLIASGKLTLEYPHVQEEMHRLIQGPGIPAIRYVSLPGDVTNILRTSEFRHVSSTRISAPISVVGRNHSRWIQKLGGSIGFAIDWNHLLLMAEILHQLRLVVYPIIFRVSYIPGGARFQPSTV